MQENDIHVEIEDGKLTLTGRHAEQKETEEKTYRIREFQSRSFERSFRLGDGIDPDGVSALMRNGILTVTLLKKEEAKPKSVKVKIGASPPFSAPALPIKRSVFFCSACGCANGM